MIPPAGLTLNIILILCPWAAVAAAGDQSPYRWDGRSHQIWYPSVYLLTEMERALALGGIEWTAPSAARVRERLIAIVTVVAVIAERSENANQFWRSENWHGSVVEVLRLGKKDCISAPPYYELGFGTSFRRGHRIRGRRYRASHLMDEGSIWRTVMLSSLWWGVALYLLAVVAISVAAAVGTWHLLTPEQRQRSRARMETIRRFQVTRR